MTTQVQHALCIIVGAEYRPVRNSNNLPFLVVLLLALLKIAVLVAIR